MWFLIVVNFNSFVCFYGVEGRLYLLFFVGCYFFDY